MTKEQIMLTVSAIKAGDWNYINELLQNNTDWLNINLMDSDGHQERAIHLACKYGQLKIVQLILEKKPDLLNVIDAVGHTPVRFAAANAHESVVDYLAKLGADLTIATNAPGDSTHGYLPIHWAAVRGYLHVVECLLKHGADINMRLGEESHHLIHITSIAGRLEVVKVLLQREPGLLNLMDAYNQTPVLWAASMGHEALVNYFATMGADLTIATHCINCEEHGYHPIHWAAKSGHHAIVQCLINHNANMTTRLSEAQSHLIHIASIAGHLKVIKVLLNKEPGLLNLIDAYSQTPVLLAAANGHVDVVAYFIAKQADLGNATNRPDHQDHGKTALNRAMDGKYYAAANLIILKITSHQGKNAILPFVQAADQALDLMVLDPELVSLFLQDNRIVTLIRNTTTCTMTEQSIDWYKRAGRRPSWFARINKNTGVSSLFKPVKELGSGKFGTVRLLQSADGQSIGVKSLKNPEINPSDLDRNALARALRKEAEFNKRAYPNDHFSGVFNLDYKKKGKKIYTNRYVMPYVKGETAWPLVSKIACPRQLAEITLHITQELQRIHSLGIIHGDLNPHNIMIDYSDNKKAVIRLIDFGCSYDINDLNANKWEPHVFKKSIVPPELCKAVKPQFNQDVYSLGSLLHFLFDDHASQKELIQLFPSINAFIIAAQNIEPMARPSLESFCQQLSNELNPEIAADHCDHMSALSTI